MPGLTTQAEIMAFIEVQFAKRIAHYVTDEGGLVREMIAGEDLVRGECVAPKTGGASREVVKNPIDSDTPTGVVYASANVGEIVIIVFAGTAYVLPNANETATIRNVMYSSDTTAGRASQATSIPSNTQHWREFGHYLETGSGAGVAALAVIHCN